MVVIRLSRGGSKKRPFNHIVVADSRASRDGRFIEQIGFFNPVASKVDKNTLSINTKRVEYWLSQGAKLSDRVKSLLKKIKSTPKDISLESATVKDKPAEDKSQEQ